jgi:hypothetical protein
MSSRRMSLLPRATLHSDSERISYIKNSIKNFYFYFYLNIFFIILKLLANPKNCILQYFIALAAQTHFQLQIMFLVFRGGQSYFKK